MNYDDLAADFPPPRDDEPESLRQDIVDELSDHLHCALKRELLASGGRQSPDTTGEQSAYNRTITRFGNPTTLARRLWLDAMKERLMAQKITAVMATTTALLGLAACLLLWQFTTDNRAAQTALLEAQQKSNAALIEKLTAALGARSDKSASAAEWIAMQVWLVDEAGEPTSGSVTISGNPFGEGTISTSEFSRSTIGRDSNSVRTAAETNSEGLAELESLPPGKYSLEVKLIDPPMQTSESIILGPDRPTELTVTCPGSPTETFALKFDINPPADLAETPLYYRAHIKPAARTIDGRIWKNTGHGTNLMVNARGKILGSIEDTKLVQTDVISIGPPLRQVEEKSYEYTLGDVPVLPVLPTEVSLNAYIPKDASWSDLDAVPRLQSLSTPRTVELEQQFDPQESSEVTFTLSADNESWSTIRELLEDANTYYKAEIELVVGSPEGPPARGFEMFAKPREGYKTSILFYVTEGEGRQTLSVSQAGTFDVAITAPWGERTTIPIAFGPDAEPGPTRIVCPVDENAPPAMPVRFEIDEPPEMAELELLYVLSLEPIGRMVDGHLWDIDGGDIHSVRDRRNRWGPDVRLMTNASGTDVKSLKSIRGQPVPGFEGDVLTLIPDESPDYRAVTYSVSVLEVLRPISNDELVALEWEPESLYDLVGLELADNGHDGKQSAFPRSTVTALADEPALLKFTTSKVSKAYYTASLEKWQRRLSQRVVTVTVSVPVGVSGQLKPQQMIDLTVTYPWKRNDDSVSYETRHLDYAILIARPERKQGQLEPTLPVSLLVEESDKADIVLAAEKALLSLSVQEGVTASPSAPPVDRIHLREILQELPDDLDKSQLIRHLR